MNKKVLLYGAIFIALSGAVLMVKTKPQPSTPVEAVTADISAENASTDMVPEQMPEMAPAPTQPESWNLVVGGNPSFSTDQVFEKPSTNSMSARMAEADAYAAQVVRVMSERNGHDSLKQ